MQVRSLSAIARLSARLYEIERQNAVVSIAVLLIAALFVLSACSTHSQQTSIAGLELALASAETLAQGYRQLPACSDSQPRPCKHLGVVANLQALDNKAYTVLAQAKAKADAGARVELTAAATAIAAFQAFVDGLGQAPGSH